MIRPKYCTEVGDQPRLMELAFGIELGSNPNFKMEWESIVAVIINVQSSKIHASSINSSARGGVRDKDKILIS